MRTILITGAANGLGAAFLEAYERQDDREIIAIDHKKVESSSPKVTTHIIDIGSQESIHGLQKSIQDRPIDLVIHSAGIRGLVPEIESQKPDDVAACETVDVMDLDTLMRAFQINAAGTFMLLRAILPNLRKANGKVIVMSSRMGSVGNNEHPNKAAGSAYAYRASKASLNMLVRSLAADVPDVTFILCHPGRVETRLVRCVEAGAISTSEALTSILPLIETWGKADSGKFYDRFGEAIQW